MTHEEQNKIVALVASEVANMTVRARDLSDTPAEEWAAFLEKQGEEQGDHLSRAVIDAMSVAYERMINEARAIAEYALHLRRGGPPAAAELYKSPYSAAKPYALALANAHRLDQGKVENPFRLGSAAAMMFDALIEADGPVLSVDLGTVAGRGYRQQVESTLRGHVLRDAGYELVKSKVGGKVAYELKRSGDVVAE